MEKIEKMEKIQKIQKIEEPDEENFNPRGENSKGGIFEINEINESLEIEKKQGNSKWKNKIKIAENRGKFSERNEEFMENRGKFSQWNEEFLENEAEIASVSQRKNEEEKMEMERGFNISLKIYLYLLLGLMCLLGNGFLPGIQSYSALPYGNKTYHLTVTLSQLANPLACFLVMLFPPLNRRIIDWLSIITLGICCYVIYLAFESPEPPLQNSLIGRVLVILSWILVMGLISYVKLAVASMFRHESQSENLFRIGIVMQVGSACGALVSLILSSFTRLLNSYDSCGDKL